VRVSFVVGLVRQQQMAKVPFAKRDDMVDAFSTDRADKPFDIGVLLGRARRCRSISDAERAKAPGDDLPISAISIANQVLSTVYDITRSPYRRHATNASYKEVRLQKDDFLGCSRRSLLR